MANLANQVDDLERRVDDAFALIDNCPTYEALTEELEVVRLSLEQRNKHVEVLEKKVEQLVAVVAKLIGGEDEPIELEAIQNSLPTNIIRLGDIESRVLALEAEASQAGDCAESLKALTIAHDSLVGSVNDMKEDVVETAKTLQGEVQGLQGQVSLLMKAASNINGGAFEMGRAKIPEPKSFGGARDAREVDNFIFDMELYFTATKNDSDAGQLKMVPMYLANDAKLWWRTKVEQSISGQCSIVTWDDFKKALKAQFYPENVAYNARCKLAELQHTGSIREYVRSFTALMLDIKDMSEADRLFNFQKGLKPWARNELVRRGVKELNTALAAAESLDDYSSNVSKRKFNSPPSSDNRPNKWGRNSSGGVDRSNSNFGGTERRTWTSGPNTHKPMSQNREQGNSRQGSAHMSTDKTNSFKTNPLKCFLCDGPHRARECPTKSALSALKAIFEEEKKPEEVEEEEDRESNDLDASAMGALRILGALEKQKPTATTERGLMYVDLLINGKNARALVDTGATDNFVADTLVTRFKLTVQADAGKIKAVNSQALNTVGVARGVSCQMGPWNGKIDFTVTPLDDFDVVIGMEFLKRARAIPVPATDCILLMGDKPCTIPTSFSPISEKKLLSALQFKKGVKRGDVICAPLKHLAQLSRSQVDTSLRRKIRDSLKKDPQAVALMKLVEEGKTRQFWLEDDLLMTRRNRVVAAYIGSVEARILLASIRR
ncbi:hypothetical protein GH714_044019 [Hevea brasiliensis]|uniref:Retrotransposon gag domain-containing protein n=1 Tax=Hevea brasiliensis TaxID=3981 RepID=A0A6A6K356_HEVBR|nr:hypothetical protein GH714_044019 [Hevea brasiliensis]